MRIPPGALCPVAAPRRCRMRAAAAPGRITSLRGRPIIAVGAAVRADASVRPLALTLGLAAAGALVLRRRAPTLTLAVSGALVLGLFAIDAAAGAIAVIAPGIALYSLTLTRGRAHLRGGRGGRRGDRRRRRLRLACPSPANRA